MNMCVCSALEVVKREQKITAAALVLYEPHAVMMTFDP